MNSNYYYTDRCPERHGSTRPQQNADQNANTQMTGVEKQSQTLIIKKSHNINVNQQEAQALVALEISLQAAIEAIIAIFDGQDDTDTVDLQQLTQQLKVLQIQREIIAIECSGDITINQQQIQIELVIQAVIQLLAKISAKIVAA